MKKIKRSCFDNKGDRQRVFCDEAPSSILFFSFTLTCGRNARAEATSEKHRRLAIDAFRIVLLHDGLGGCGRRVRGNVLRRARKARRRKHRPEERKPGGRGRVGRFQRRDPHGARCSERGVAGLVLREAAHHRVPPQAVEWHLKREKSRSREREREGGLGMSSSSSSSLATSSALTVSRPSKRAAVKEGGRQGGRPSKRAAEAQATPRTARRGGPAPRPAANLRVSRFFLLSLNLYRSQSPT